jgi:hypothetical protein
MFILDPLFETVQGQFKASLPFGHDAPGNRQSKVVVAVQEANATAWSTRYAESLGQC